VSVVELLEELPLGEVRVLRAAQARPTQDGRVTLRLLEGLAPSPGLDVAELALPPRHVQSADPKPRGSRAHAYVLEGKLIAGPMERITELGPGDYASFPIDVPHVLEAGLQAARLLLLSQLTA
jgi:quercetin dioxygenase-like cupin family protein